LKTRCPEKYSEQQHIDVTSQGEKIQFQFGGIETTTNNENIKIRNINDD